MFHRRALDLNLDLRTRVAAKDRSVVNKHDARAGTRGGDCRTRARRPCTDDHDVVFSAVRDANRPCAALALRRRRSALCQHDRVATREPSALVDEAQFHLPGIQRKFASVLPLPASLARRAEDTRLLSANRHGEPSGMMLGNPVLCAHPAPPCATFRNFDCRHRVGDRPARARCDEISAAHLVRELRIDLPTTLRLEILRLDKNLPVELRRPRRIHRRRDFADGFDHFRIRRIGDVQKTYLIVLAVRATSKRLVLPLEPVRANDARILQTASHIRLESLCPRRLVLHRDEPRMKQPAIERAKVELAVQQRLVLGVRGQIAIEYRGVGIHRHDVGMASTRPVDGRRAPCDS